jgi:sugar diacid utilization regulator
LAAQRFELIGKEINVHDQQGVIILSA